MNDSSPLMEITMGYVRENYPGICPEAYFRLQSATTAYLAKSISYEDCSKAFQWMIQTTEPIDKLKAILSVTDEPIPAASDGDSEIQRRKTRPWSEYEDQRLLAGIHKYGLNNWSMVARFVGNSRTRAQAAQKWFRGLDPKISKNQWSQTEEEKLVHLISIAGKRGWTFVAHGMGNRSDVQCRYHWNQMVASKRSIAGRRQAEQSMMDFGQSRRSPVQLLPSQLRPSFSTQSIQMIPFVKDGSNLSPPAPPTSIVCPIVPEKKAKQVSGVVRSISTAELARPEEKGSLDLDKDVMMLFHGELEGKIDEFKDIWNGYGTEA